MSTPTLQERLAEVVFTNVTPFKEDGSVDFDRAAEQAVWLVDRGAKVVTPGSNTGEFSSLGLDELKQLYKVVADAVKDHAVVLAGVGWSSPIAVELANSAYESGAHCAMIHSPVHTYIDPEGMRRYYDELLNKTDIPLVLYNRNTQVTDDLVYDLVQEDRVVAVKYSVNNLNNFATLVERAKGVDVTWICGTAERWAPFFALGGSVGYTTGLGNFFPELTLKLQEALRGNDYDAAMAIRSDLLKIESLRQTRETGNNVSVVKEAMRQRGLDTGFVRDPVLPVDDAIRAEITKELKRFGLID